MDYNFELVHISGKKNGRADALSRRPDYGMGEEDNKQLVVLPPKFFARAYARVTGSEEADPNSPGFLAAMGISPETREGTSRVPVGTEFGRTGPTRKPEKHEKPSEDGRTPTS
jgi:hypothetical protein